MSPSIPKITPKRPSLSEGSLNFIQGYPPTVAIPAEGETKSEIAPSEPSKTAVEEPPSRVPRKETRGLKERKRSGKTVRSFSVYLDPSLLKRVQREALDEDVTPSDIIEKALDLYFSKR